jgi:cytochrome c-type biogenesis protein CcmH/NrfG
VVLPPGRPAAAYRRALRQAQELARLSPNNPTAVFFLGVAQCRAGLSREAIGTLRGLERLPAERRRHLDTVARAFLALAQAQAGAAAEARRSLAELARVIDRDPAGRGQALKVREEVVKALERSKQERR